MYQPAFRKALLEWFRANARDLPWRQTSNPYRILVSEIMLQQTRVAAVIPYYEKFLERFPNPAALAKAGEDELLQSWAGLGYYTRVRNLQMAARQIVKRRKFPDVYEEILELKGVGEYTAAAVASIAFGQPHAAVDGNVLRVMARVFNDPSDIGFAAGKSTLGDRAQSLLDKKSPGDFNQAMMELGATLCVPRDPRCLLCPVTKHCAALAAGTQSQLPVKSKRMVVENLERTLLLVEHEGAVLLWHRASEERKLQGFWELPEQYQLAGAKLDDAVGSFRHSIMNHNYRVNVTRAVIKRVPAGFEWVSKSKMDGVPLSTMARKALALAACGRL